GALTRVAGENVGTYAILQGTLALSANYILNFTGANLTITEFTIFVTADPQSKIYGEADPELTYQFTPALIGSDAFTGALTRVAGENVGTYAIQQGTLALSANYILDFTSAGFNITPKGLSVTADNKSKVFDGLPFTGFTVSYDGFVFGEDETALSGTLIFTGNAVEATEVGTYTITPSGLTSTNYDITFYDGQLEITPVGRTLKVFLQGAYNPGTGEMNTGIISQLPTTQPYNVNPWFYNGIESVVPIPAGMVDWVLVDLRIGTEAGSLYERRAGILYNDGTVAVEFSTIEPGVGYYIVVWHRNHMPVMSANAVELYEMTSAYDFTVLANCFGTNPVILLEGTVYGMIAGDVNSNGVLQYSGPGNDRGPVIAKIVAVSGNNNINASVSNGYWVEDVNLDNTILYLGTGNDRAIIYQNLNSLVGPELNNIYTSEVPGAVISSKSTGAKEGSLDIALSGSNSAIQIELLSRAFLSDGLIDNIQFTLAWNAGDHEISDMLAYYTSAFMLTPQGPPAGSNGIIYQVYASINLTALPAVFNPGDKISLITFANPTGLLTEKRLWIADNEHTASQNGMYYVSVWGDDHTGEIVLWSLGMGENSPGCTIHIYPNPLKEGRLNIHFTAQENQMYDILIYDMFGQLVKQDKLDVSTSHAVVYSLDVSPLNPGVYLINVSGKSAPFRDRFIIR
ncbi:MAG: MBG domain-containing protein, partial [Bacteroidales bacterium]